jgi:hypothetical protein
MIKRLFKGIAIALGILLALFAVMGLIFETNFAYDNLAKDENDVRNFRNFDSQMDDVAKVFVLLDANCVLKMYETTQQQEGAATKASEKLDAYSKWIRATEDFHQIEKLHPPRWFLRLMPSFRQRYEST